LAKHHDRMSSMLNIHTAVNYVGHETGRQAMGVILLPVCSSDQFLVDAYSDAVSKASEGYLRKDKHPSQKLHEYTAPCLTMLVP